MFITISGVEPEMLLEAFELTYISGGYNFRFSLLFFVHHYAKLVHIICWDDGRKGRGGEGRGGRG